VLPLCVSDFRLRFAGRLKSLEVREQATGGKLNHLNWSVGMELAHPPHRQSRRVEPSLWTNEPVNDALSLLDNSLRGNGTAPCGDEHTDGVHSLLEEKARLREPLAQLSELIRSNVVSAR
jgi:hypothetical protein